MNLLFLRGKVDKRTQQVFRVEHSHDMWTHLAANILQEGDKGEIMYWGGDRAISYSWNFAERWIPSFDLYRGRHPSPTPRDGFSDFIPDVIFARGGFNEYDMIIKQWPKAITVYYGAGQRFCPKDMKYDIVIVDTPYQREFVSEKYPDSIVREWIKPTIDDIFCPDGSPKEYDVCYVANDTQQFKGQDFIYNTLPHNLSLLHLGIDNGSRKVPSNIHRVRVKRDEMSGWYNRCSVGVVPYKNIDSSPRVISEMLACGLPVVALDRVNCPIEYFGVGAYCDKEYFWEAVYNFIGKDPNIVRKYYLDNCSLKKASVAIRSWIYESKATR